VAFHSYLVYVTSDTVVTNLTAFKITNVNRKAEIRLKITVSNGYYEPSVRAGIAQSVWRLSYGLDDRGSRVRFPAGAGNFSLHHRVQKGCGAHPASSQMGTRGSFPGGKAAGA
jgi:hypothetical protein